MGRTTRRTSRKRSKLAGRAITASAALILGGGGLVAVNVYANAEESPPSDVRGRSQAQAAGAEATTIRCPDVGNELPDVPADARAEVDRELAALDTQITQAYARFAEADTAGERTAVLGPLEERRRPAIDTIQAAIERGGPEPAREGLDKLDRLDGMAPCTLRADDDGPPGGGQDQEPGQEQDQDQDQGPDQGQGQDQGPGQGQAGNGPEAGDFVDITSVRPNVQKPRKQRGASRGTFTTRCGTNRNGKFNPDNVIVAPGVSNGAHHMHDYVGNQETDAFSSDRELAGGRTSCRNQGDKSTYYWPVLRLQNGTDEDDADADGGGRDKNVGEIQTPEQVTLEFVGSPVGKVTAMPRFLRVITGDAKAFTNGDANANASWSCTGFENRQLKDKYPICPEGSEVVRTFAFQSCWDGRNTDSANHRTHVAFADPRSGRCPRGFRAIPQLVQRVVYDVPPGPGFAVDSFPEQLHKPVTDHGDFINVFDERLMRRVAQCINENRRCS
ncbi:hypothetical protein GCM10018785_39140 [Streptomyces longispororuber]|uniref:DUF1996 domain-containing protein n=1 Tax=Streptomyces longispororuber TaxID=68230 RepID=A0A918ZSZ1_9ACTN|nr:DUF1996 domain-containing protein [Streptomyces longispororuber]GHE66509.1 hypothetical protein GCM10018785_39140 [Streptomyces longispororuber]